MTLAGNKTIVLTTKLLDTFNYRKVATCET